MEQQGTLQRRQPLLTVADVADIMAVRPKTVRAWLARREIPFVRAGHTIRIRPAALDEFITEREKRTLPRSHRSRANARAMSAAD